MYTLDVILTEEGAGEPEAEVLVGLVDSWLLAPLRTSGRENWGWSLGFELPLDGRLLPHLDSGLGGRAEVS